ncbi:MAG TPA: Crp/Fnr family transcriptional regulator [Mesorhizobium sp.]|jgi:CRP-like cAMP-binding protein|uniref:Crp/Fnr family transcriptional regulator n=1 Tax=Mesorhizobium sp. TaxID=1871066 RepID=UPI002DDD182C|nr:Crp/Fnr family transcriptional regulator [Mesorhizobium sp.]HEV2505154.1 Crp/Fnr family transcriptional regulator [Mesorhizobium sp.]
MGNRFVEKLQGYGSLGEEDVTALLAATVGPRNIAPRKDLIREGDRPGPVFVILDGWACRYKILPNGTRQILAYLMPGDSCDLHVGLLKEMDHSIQTVTEAVVATIDRHLMDSIMDRHPRVAKAMYIAQLVDEGTMRAWITSMGRRSSIERVAHLMCELYLRAQNIGITANTQLELPLSQLLLADSLGMTPVHLNRVLKELRKTGAMTLQRGSLIITNPVTLIQVAGFDENYLHRRMRRAA